MSPTTGSHLSRSSRDLSCPVALSPPEFRPYFTSLRRVLCSVRSRYLFTIGLGECLALAVDACHIHEGFPTPDTLEPAHAVLVVDTGLSPCFAPHSRGLRDDDQAIVAGPNTTLAEAFGLGCVAFTRGY